MRYSHHPRWLEDARRLLRTVLPAVMALVCSKASVADQMVVFVKGQPLEADGLVSEVLVRNPGIQARQAVWEAAKTRIKQSASLQDPVIAYTLAPQSLDSDNARVAQGFSFSQHLPWPGKLDLQVDVASLESEIAALGISQLTLALTEATRVAFADWYFVHAAIRINEANYSLLQEFQDIAEIKYAAGTASKQEALNAEVEKLYLEHNAIVLNGKRRDIRAIINTLLYRQPDLALPPPANLPNAVQLPVVADLRMIARRSHPDLVVLGTDKQKNVSQQKLAEKDFYPDFNISLGYNTAWDSSKKRFTVGAAVNIPLMGKRRARSSEIQADFIRLDSEHKARSAEIVGLVQRTYDKVREDEHVVALFSDRLIPLAEENLQTARSDYEAGRGGFLDMLFAEKNLMQNRLQLEHARSDYFKHLSALERAVGSPQIFRQYPAMEGES